MIVLALAEDVKVLGLTHNRADATQHVVNCRFIVTSQARRVVMAMSYIRGAGSVSPFESFAESLTGTSQTGEESERYL